MRMLDLVEQHLIVAINFREGLAELSEGLLARVRGNLKQRGSGLHDLARMMPAVMNSVNRKKCKLIQRCLIGMQLSTYLCEIHHGCAVGNAGLMQGFDSRSEIFDSRGCIIAY